MVNSSSFTTELVLQFTLQAGHSLDTREELHDHLWNFELTFTGDPIRGRIIDLPLLESKITELFQPFQKKPLNGKPRLNEAAQVFPTCETLGESFYGLIENETIPPLRAELNPTLKLISVKVTLGDLDGRTYGSAILRKKPI